MAAEKASDREKEPFGPPDVAGASEQGDRHEGSGDKQEHLESIRVRQIVSEQKDQHEQEVGRTVENNKTEPDADKGQHKQPKPGDAWSSMIILGQRLFEFSKEQQERDQHRRGNNEPELRVMQR